jgi:predicted transcriptional regulator
MPAKRPRKLTKAEKEFVALHAGDRSPKQIAEELGRPEALIEDFLRSEPEAGRAATTTDPKEITDTLIRQDLRASEVWKAITQEFGRDELKLFEETYVRWMGQFKGDVLPSEETQIFQAAKFEILMSREMKEQKRIRDEKERIEAQAEEMLKAGGGDLMSLSEQERSLLLDMGRRVDGLRTAEVTHAGNFLKLQSGHAELMKALKGTRDQRFKEIEKAGVNFLDVIKQLSTREGRERAGRQMGLLKLAGKRAGEKLGELITYGDGVADRPILNCETAVGNSEEAATGGGEE